MLKARGEAFTIQLQHAVIIRRRQAGRIDGERGAHRHAQLDQFGAALAAGRHPPGEDPAVLGEARMEGPGEQALLRQLAAQTHDTRPIAREHMVPLGAVDRHAEELAATVAARVRGEEDAGGVGRDGEAADVAARHQGAVQAYRPPPHVEPRERRVDGARAYSSTSPPGFVGCASTTGSALASSGTE